MIKKIITITLMLFVCSFMIHTNAAMTPNVDFPPNQASNSWSQPVLTYNGQYVISLNGTSTTNSKSIAISIPMGDVMYFVFTYYDVNMNAKQVTSQNNGFNRYQNVLINAMGQSNDIYVQSLENEVHTWKLEVYTIFNFTAGGGNTGTWRTNIMNTAYVSQSPLYGQLTVLSEIIYNSAYDRGYQDGENDGFINGADYWEQIGYQAGLVDGNTGFNAYTMLFAVLGNIFSFIFTIEIAPGLYTGYIAGFFILIGIMGMLFSIKGGKKQ